MDNLTAGNPVAHRVRVYYTGSDTLYEGEPLCYSFKTTRNWFGGSVSDAGVVTASEYVAEGSHNASKYMCVESPMQASITSMDTTAGSNVITGDGTDFANLHVGMAVSIASATDSAFDGNYVITAVGALGITITLDMTAAEAALVTLQSDVTVQIDNISDFAGVVAKGGWNGKAGPRVIDIYVPNGAVVPVRNDQNCVAGRTILSVASNEQYLTAPLGGTSRPVAIAWETVDTATTTGLVLAKLDPNVFIHQHADNNSLLVDDQDTTWQRVNYIDIEFAGSQWLEVATVKLAQLADCTGTGLALKGQLSLDKVTSGGYSTAIEGAVEVGAGFGGTATADGGFRAGTFKINVASGADLSDQYTSCLYLEHYIHAAATGPLVSSLIQVNATVGTNAPDYFFLANDLLAVAYTANVTHAEDAKVGAIKCYIGGGVGECYLWLYDGVA